jgi:anti-sigma factor (TIGR02949 family)
MDILNHKTLDCSEVVRALWEYLDGRAGAESRVAIDDHLAQCEGCRTHFAFEARLVKTLAELRRVHSDPEKLRESVLETLRTAGLGVPDGS